MFLLNEPYVSKFLEETIKNNQYKVLKNEFVQNFDIKDCLCDEIDFIDYIKNNNDVKLYSNSEDSIEWIIKNLNFTSIPRSIELFKNKAKFRNLLKSLYPNFYYEEVSFENLKNIDKKSIKFPIILKPTVGFLSFGVYKIDSEIDFDNIIKKIDLDIEKYKNFFPKEVINTSNFIIEQKINGEEFAIDIYYNNEGEAVILNIFKHPFINENDVSDRLYYTSKEIMLNYKPLFENLLNKIGKLADLKNFPIHIELRVNENEIIPIEVNPMRFAGWCDTDLAYYAYGINVYEYYLKNKKPDWDKILKNTNNDIFYFTAVEVPTEIPKQQIKKFNYDEYLKNISMLIDLRKFDFTTKPLFAFVFGKTNNYEEIKEILSLDMKKFIEYENQI